MQKKKIIGVVVVVLGIGVAYYAISPLFNNIEVDDALPENIVTEQVAVNPINESAQFPSGFETLSITDQTEMIKEMEKANEVSMPMMEEVMPKVVEIVTAPQETPQVVPVTPTSFPVMGTAGHPAGGIVKVLETTTGSVLRFEDFSTINGPNLHVYLSKDLKGKDFIDLGKLKGTSGNINYDVPDGVDLSEYKYIMHWCVPFGVLFNYAEIN